MSRRSQYLVLPLLGALSAIIAFTLAAPYSNSLVRTNLSPDDPANHYTTGTQWDRIEHIAFGALLLGTFAFFIRFNEHGLKRGAISGLIGAVLGAIVVPLANSTADNIGMKLDRASGGQNLIDPLFWCALVPSTIAFSLAICLGISGQRIKRAITASMVGFIATAICQYFIGPMLQLAVKANLVFASVPELLSTNTDIRSGIPGWQAMEICIGVTMGLLFAYAENNFRAAWVRLVAGRNEYRDWNLDRMAHRIGTEEFAEIPLRGYQGVAPVHAEIIRQGNAFLLRDLVQGTLLNGYPVQQAWLNPGDQITVGQATLIFSSKLVPGAFQPLPMDQATVRQPVHTIQATQATAVVAAPIEHKLSDSFGHTYHLQPGITTIGRDPSNMIAMTWDTSVSRFHAEISFDQRGVSVKDLGSSNGSRINGNPISQGDLQPGDTLELGKATLRYESSLARSATA